MKRKEKERFFEIYNKIVQAEEVEFGGECDFFTSMKAKGVKLSKSDFEFFKPILEAQYHVRFTTGKYECELTSAMYDCSLINEDGAYIAFHSGMKTETLLMMRYLIDMICSPVGRIKYSDLLWGADQ